MGPGVGAPWRVRTMGLTFPDLGVGRGPWPPSSIPWPRGPMAPLLGGGEYTLERLSRWGVGACIPPCSLGACPPQHGPPDARGPLEVLVGIVLGELDSSTPRVSGTIET